MTKLVDLKITEFIKELASDKPAPGGGSVSALGGAVAAGLAAMVGNITSGKEKFAEVQNEMKELVNKASKLHNELNKLIDDDTDAFNEIMAAFRMPKDDVEARSAAIQKATIKATEVPLEVAKKSFEVFDLALIAAEKGNQNAITDIGVAALFAEAAVKGSLLNVRINVSSIKDEELKTQFTKEMKEMLAVVDEKREAVIKKVEEVLSSWE
ncbi:MAG: cyclodeaminase/cyclohydrolase family protein [Candidatus Kariarchaeaceae archaeon]